MKKWLVLVIMAAVILTVSGVGIGEEKKDTDKPVIKARGRKAPGSQAEQLRNQVRQGRGGASANPQDKMKMFKAQQAEQLKKAQEEPLALIRELTAIRKIAEKEGAKGTVAALDKLIAKNKDQMNQRVKVLKERQAKFQGMMEKRNRPGTRPEGPEAQPKKRATSRGTKKLEKKTDKK